MKLEAGWSYTDALITLLFSTLTSADTLRTFFTYSSNFTLVFFFFNLLYLPFSQITLTQSLGPVQLFMTTWNVALQPPLSRGFFRQEYWSGLPFPPARDLPYLGIEPASPVSNSLQANTLLLSHLGSLRSPLEAGKGRELSKANIDRIQESIWVPEVIQENFGRSLYLRKKWGRWRGMMRKEKKERQEERQRQKD